MNRMTTMKPDWRLKLRLISARILIKLGRLTHADYSSSELKSAVDKHLPETFPIEVPVSKGELSLLEAQISMPKNEALIDVHLLGSLLIGPTVKPIYRAHITIHLQAYPIYEVDTNIVKLEKLLVSNVQLVNDEYSIIEDSKELLGLLFPVPFQNLLTGTVKSAIGLLTGGGSDLAVDYMKLYLSGSKQRILDYHRPQIEALVSDFAQSEELQYQLDPKEFEEYLFSLYGREVIVEEGNLRFKF
ncbi:hypothetical protein [Glaciecola petra]|uniref:DUF1439 domain-containing protein n=1 Tax=Glaciecola petra TaxID=3075602 RepID=A0ABU2ZNB2_9ALTE|nr:hypothetical protein [Aestuariibacter sp. P117]MDT0594117.1 hypothetical protein [Aestuariibacter sp. P117]